MNDNKTYKRAFTNANQYEKKVLYSLFFFAVVPVILVIVLFYALFHNLIASFLGSDLSGPFMGRFWQFSILILVYYSVLTRFMFLFVHRSLGPYERLLRELDLIIAGTKKGPLYVRQDDYGKEFIKRINLLLEKVEQSTKTP